MRLVALSLLLSCAIHARVATGQTPISLDHFDGWESWPLYEPGDVVVANDGLTPLRIQFDGLFPGKGGVGVPPLDSLTMLMDLIEENFRGKPAVWIQWLSRPPLSRAASPALDALLVDRETFRLLFRIAASRPGEWSGTYEVIQARPEGVTQVTVTEGGDTEKFDVKGERFFDFATYQFLFPFMELREGLAFRLKGYEYLEKQSEVLPVRVVGRTRVSDTQGMFHDVWRIDVMPSHRATLITFFVSPEPPYFYGWDYRVTRTGSSAIKMTLRSWTPTSTATPDPTTPPR